MFGNKRKISVSKEKLDQAILKANSKLAKKKVRLAKEIDALKEESKDVKNQSKDSSLIIKKNEKQIKTLSKEITLLEVSKSSAVSKVAELNKKEGEISSSINLLSIQEEDIIKNLDTINKKVIAEESKLNKYESDIDELKALKDILNKETKELNKDLEALNKSYSELQESFNSKELEFKVKLESKEKEIEEASCVLSESLDSINSMKLEEEALEISVNEIEKTMKNKIKDADQAFQRQKVNIDIETDEAKDKLNKINAHILESQQELDILKEERILEKSKLDKAIKRSKNFKLDFIAEIARLKLKNKVDTIDKAGLKEVFDG